MNTPDILGDILEALDAAGIPYMLTGSFASAYHGTPRATQDIDIVIAPTQQQLRRLLTVLASPSYYVDENAALEAFRHESQFNVLALASGWKIDLIIRKSRSFSHAEFDRRISISLDGRQIAVASAEDIVIAKLEWAKLGESDRQIEDVAGILRLRAGDLDREYLEYWIKSLGLEREWQRALRKADQ